MPSPAMVVACVALVAALVGTAVAAKPVTKKQVNKQIKKAVNKGVKKGTSANSLKLAGQVPGVYQSSAASDRRTAPTGLTGANTAYLSTTITLPAQKTVTAFATIEGSGAGSDDNMNCFINIGGSSGVNVATGLAPSVVATQATLALTHSAVLGAGTHTVQTLCNQGVGSVTTISDRALSVVASG
jgi:hypothetical protein